VANGSKTNNRLFSYSKTLCLSEQYKIRTRQDFS